MQNIRIDVVNWSHDIFVCSQLVCHQCISIQHVAGNILITLVRYRSTEMAKTDSVKRKASISLFGSFRNLGIIRLCQYNWYPVHRTSMIKCDEFGYVCHPASIQEIGNTKKHDRESRSISLRHHHIICWGFIIKLGFLECTYIHVYMHACVPVPVCERACLYVCVRVCACTCVCVCVCWLKAIISGLFQWFCPWALDA